MTSSVPAILAAEAGGGPPDFMIGLTALVVAAAVIAYLALRTRQVPIVGFLIAGVIIGPNALGLVPRAEVVEAAAEIGVVLLLFTIGIEFSLDRLKQVRRLVILGGATQVTLATAATAGIMLAAGVEGRTALYSGLLVSLSSTAIVLKLLAARGETATATGRTAVGLLIFQDLAVVGMVVAVPMLAGSRGGLGDLAVAVGTGAALVAAVLFGARRVVPPLLAAVARTCSQEVFLLVVVALCFATAYLTSLAGVSLSLGAFLAGLLVSESHYDLQALGEILPLQILFAAVFFISIGMLLDVRFLAANLPLILGVLAAAVMIKAVTTAIAVRLAGQSVAVAGGAALMLAQVGEFSFVLEIAGSQAGLSPAGMGETGSQVFIAATVVSMALTPAMGAAGRRFHSRFSRRNAVGGDTHLEREHTGHVIVAGYGGTGQRLVDLLERVGIDAVITTLDPNGAEHARANGRQVLQGDARRDVVLREAGLVGARLLVLADQGLETVRAVTTVARGLRPDLQVIAHLDDDAPPEAVPEGVTLAVHHDEASALAVGVQVLRHFGLTAAAIAQHVDQTANSGWSPATLTQHISHLDQRRTVTFDADPDTVCSHLDAIRPVTPSAPGCEECLRMGAGWVHLRICMSCGHVGCCDSSPNRHATAHHRQTSHPIILSGEPREDWGWCYPDQLTI